MQCFTTSRSAVRSASTVGSGLCSRTAARRLAMRRAAATRKCPEPHAGSQTVTASKASAIASDGSVPALVASTSACFCASSRTGSSVESSRQSMSEVGV